MILHNNGSKGFTEFEEGFRFMSNMIPDIVWTALPSGYRDFHNIKFTEYTGLSTENAKGEGWKTMVHPEDLFLTESKWQESLITGNPYENEYRFKKHDGTYRWFLIRAIPWRIGNGTIIKWFGTATDIHSGKLTNIQLKQTTADLTKSNHGLARVNDILNHFVYIAAHDLRSPIINMTMLFTLLKEEKEQKKRDEMISFIEKSVFRLDRTISGLMEVINVENLELNIKTLDLDILLNTVISDLSSIYPDIPKYITSGFKNSASVRYIQPYLISIMKNIISNAYKYRSEKRPLEIRISTERVKGFVKLQIKDNGKGFNMTSSKTIFKPFKRLTEEGEGKGVGLFLVKNIVEKNGGKIEVYSKENQGTEFTIYLKEYDQF